MVSAPDDNSFWYTIIKNFTSWANWNPYIPVFFILLFSTLFGDLLNLW